MAKQLRQARAVLRAAKNWLCHDLPEIVAPSSMPNPPGFVAEQQQAPRRNYAALFLRACRRYAETWDSSRMAQQADQKERQGRIQAGREEPTLSEEFAAAAKGGGAALKPFLASLYETRARAYKDAVQQFVEGYKTGFKAAMASEVPPDVAGDIEAARSSSTGTSGAGGTGTEGGSSASCRGAPSAAGPTAAAEADAAGTGDHAAAAAAHGALPPGAAPDPAAGAQAPTAARAPAAGAAPEAAARAAAEGRAAQARPALGSGGADGAGSFRSNSSEGSG